MEEYQREAVDGQCLSRRVESAEVLATETAAWSSRRNAAAATVSWRFTVEDARIKLRHLYPSIEA